MPPTKVVSLVRSAQPAKSWMAGLLRFLPRVKTMKDWRKIEVQWQKGQLSSRGNVLFKEHLLIEPEMACAILTRDLPDDVSVTMQAHGSVYRGLHLSIQGDGYSNSQYFSPDTGEVSAGELYVDDEQQYHGLGRTIMRNQIEFFSAVGMEKFNILAGSTAGGYVWARFGFLPVNIEKEPWLRDTIRERYAVLKDALTEKEQKQIESLMGLQEKQNLWHIADTQIDVTQRLKSIFTAAANMHRSQDGSPLFEDFAKRAKDGGKLTSGQILLAGASWNGELDLTSAQQMQRAGDYVGGWKYIGFE